MITTQDLLEHLPHESRYCSFCECIRNILEANEQSRSDAASLAAQPAAPCGEDEITTKQLMTRLDVMDDHYKDTMFCGDWPVLGFKRHNAAVDAIRARLAQPKPRVSRESVRHLVMTLDPCRSYDIDPLDHNLHARTEAIVQWLAEVGVTVEGEKK